MSQLLAITTLMSEDMRQGLAERGLTHARARALWELGAAAGTLTQRELAAALDVSPRNVTTLMDALERTGFAERTRHPTDRRAVALVLTEQGRLAAASLHTDMASLASQLFAGIPHGELEAFQGILRRVGEKLASIAKRERGSRRRSRKP